MSELIPLNELALSPSLDQYSRDDIEVYFLQHWTADKFFALRKHSCISIYNLNFLIVLADGLDFQKLNQMRNPRILCSFRKRASDNIGFVYITVDKKGW